MLTFHNKIKQNQIKYFFFSPHHSLWNQMQELEQEFLQVGDLLQVSDVYHNTISQRNNLPNKENLYYLGQLLSFEDVYTIIHL